MIGGSALKAARLNKGLTVREAARRIGVTADILLRAEHGSAPRPKAARKIADFYGYKVTDIWPVDQGKVAAA
jgi:transcriptional regulator with XRE-family HTH domain